MGVKVIESQANFDEITKGTMDKLVVVDFTATWCGPCKHIGPIFEKFSEEFADITCIKVDVDENEDIARSCEIKCMPTFHFYKNGQKIDDFSGANGDKLKEKIMQHK